MFNTNRAKYIGSGSSRRVFDLGNGYVMKIAKNPAGIAQNKMEYEISSRNSSYLFAKVIRVSNDYSRLIMEKAYKIYSFSDIYTYFEVESMEEVLKLKIFQDLKNKYNLLFGDFRRKSSWGIINGRPVLIDYGFTKDIRRRYYSFY